MGAESIASRLGGHRAGGGYMCRCPAHHDNTPSMSVCDAGGKTLVHCFAGCAQEDVVAALRGRGLWGDGRHGGRGGRHDVGPLPHHRRQDDDRRRRAALGLWQASKWAPGSPVETYFRSRGLTLTPPPGALRYHPNLKHPTGDTWPAMVGLVTGADGEPLGVHRTYLAADGRGKAPVSPQKMSLGATRGGAVRLAEPDGDALLTGEGIETCLAGMEASGLPAWAALSAPGLAALELPADVREVVILADGDEPGERAARAAAYRWAWQGRRVCIARPPAGMDFNDLLLAEAAQ
jgi:hypothetical protein